MSLAGTDAAPSDAELWLATRLGQPDLFMRCTSVDDRKRRARIAINALQGASGQVLSDAGTAFGVAALVPPVTGAAEAVGSVISAAELYFDAASHLLPSELKDLTFELTRGSFLEDEEATGQ